MKLIKIRNKTEPGLKGVNANKKRRLKSLLGFNKSEKAHKYLRTSLLFPH